MSRDKAILSASITVNTVICVSYALTAMGLMLGGKLDVLHAITPFHLRTNMLIAMAAILASVFYVAAFGRRKILWVAPQVILVPLMFVSSLDLLDCGANFYYCVA